jgi:hypothetical protein
MPRIRTIKPEYFTDDDLAALSPLARLAFIGLWTQADKAGRLEDRPRRLKALIAPYDDVDFDALLDQLVEGRFLVRYEVDGRRYLQVRTWEKHQRPHHSEPESAFPGLNSQNTVSTPSHDGDFPSSHGDYPSSAGEKTLGKERKGKERKGMEGSVEAAGVRRPLAHAPPNPTTPDLTRRPVVPTADTLPPWGRVLRAWAEGYEAATGQPAMLRPGTADQNARSAADWFTKADAWTHVDALVGLFLDAPEFVAKRQLGMFVANLPQLAAWLAEHGPGVPYGDEDAIFRSQRARELAALEAEQAKEAACAHPQATNAPRRDVGPVRLRDVALRAIGGAS